MNPILLIFFIFVVYYFIPHIFKKIQVKSFSTKVENSQSVYLTFDDGPTKESTVAILNLLNEEKAKATFFPTGKNVLSHPEVTDRIINEGHSIGSHSFAHPHAWKTLPIKTYMDWKKNQKVFNSILGKRYTSYRPPYGKFNFVSMIMFMLSPQKAIFWTVDPEDYAKDNPEEIAKMVIEQLKPGSVVLLHDARSESGQSDPEVTLKALKLILNHGKENQINFETIDHIYQS
ncbi:polysaccharide deacetylase family protein [Vibrio sp. TRT 21S02]|uniref:polysaccharide deacetylase family protein n=1 Tax=unclassified Vibrio TaxID=2614977 RepID=UPI003CF8284A